MADDLDAAVVGVPVENLLQHAGMRVLTQVHRVARKVHERLQRVDAIRVGALVDAVEEGQLGVHGEARHGLIGQQHELLDQALGFAALRAEDLRRLVLLVQHELGLIHLEVHRAALPALLLQTLGQPAHRQQRLRHLLRQRLRTALEEAVHAVVGQARTGADDRAGQLVIHHAPRRGHVHE